MPLILTMRDGKPTVICKPKLPVLGHGYKHHTRPDFHRPDLYPVRGYNPGNRVNRTWRFILTGQWSIKP